MCLGNCGLNPQWKFLLMIDRSCAGRLRPDVCALSESQPDKHQVLPEQGSHLFVAKNAKDFVNCWLQPRGRVTPWLP